MCSRAQDPGVLYECTSTFHDSMTFCSGVLPDAVSSVSVRNRGPACACLLRSCTWSLAYVEEHHSSRVKRNQKTNPIQTSSSSHPHRQQIKESRTSTKPGYGMNRQIIPSSFFSPETSNNPRTSRACDNLRMLL